MVVDTIFFRVFLIFKRHRVNIHVPRWGLAEAGCATLCRCKKLVRGKKIVRLKKSRFKCQKSERPTCVQTRASPLRPAQGRLALRRLTLRRLEPSVRFFN